MAWIRYSDGLLLDPIIEGPPEALVVLLHDSGDVAKTLSPVAAEWAMAIPRTAIMVPEGAEQHDPPPTEAHSQTKMSSGDHDTAELDCAARRLEPLIARQLHACRLDASRAILAGFGYGGTLALHIGLRRSPNYAGILAFAGKPGGTLVTSLVGHGIDARGVLLAGPTTSDEAIRHGGAYLAELVATAR